MISNIKDIKFKGFTIGNNEKFTLIAGPCVMESKDHALKTANEIHNICDILGLNFIYKSSFDKANRTSLKSSRGPGIDDSMEIFKEVKDKIGCPVITDVHEKEQISLVSEVVDVIQIPAFLCRQTDLLIESAKSNLPIMVKKGQFLAPWDMKNVAEKLSKNGNGGVMICERGASFGYNTLVSDFRSIPILKEFGHPVVFDATHSVQQPGGLGDKSSGQREFVPTLATAASALGVAAIFMETHEDPDNAPSDGPNMWPLDKLKNLLQILIKHDEIAKSQNN
ncbi:MAG: 2-dehydro-3-deoxyphosphooctonate aldolase [Alphaproteobacteria bacterium MarineAlpha9_Bin3]|nr:MAG: 2-dehydro-3-deoxyphosphooctonate aldolase [Alphaproteobacteria bacterium MarineAlpha9_Bin3]|tara:strand:+ start:36212 stop:37051 length:840 start_codon:yes stop_codon:yes gene_type:complete